MASVPLEGNCLVSCRRDLRQAFSTGLTRLTRFFSIFILKHLSIYDSLQFGLSLSILYLKDRIFRPSRSAALFLFPPAHSIYIAPFRITIPGHPRSPSFRTIALSIVVPLLWNHLRKRYRRHFLDKRLFHPPVSVQALIRFAEQLRFFDALLCDLCAFARANFP